MPDSRPGRGEPGAAQPTVDAADEQRRAEATQRPRDAAIAATPPGDTLAPNDAVAATSLGVDISINMAAYGAAELFPVASWDKYEFLSLLGRGGMGAVYKARDCQLNRTVALKFLRSDDPKMIQRFLREAHTQARLDHPNLCRIYEVGQVEG